MWNQVLEKYEISINVNVKTKVLQISNEQKKGETKYKRCNNWAGTGRQINIWEVLFIEGNGKWDGEIQKRLIMAARLYQILRENFINKKEVSDTKDKRLGAFVYKQQQCSI